MNIPNVSSIYRQLTSLQYQSHLQNKNQPHSNDRKNYNYEKPSQQSYQPAFQNNQAYDQKYEEKQQRHNELMDKLQKAKRDLNIESAISYGSKEDDYAYHHTSFNQSNNFALTAAGRFQSTDQEFKSKNQQRWCPPNIKYRHIQDFKPKQIESEQMQPKLIESQSISPNSLLYQDNKHNKNVYQPTQLRVNQESQLTQNQSKEMKKPIITENESGEKEQNDSQYENEHWINKESKYEETIESYYELCMKKPSSKKMKKEQDFWKEEEVDSLMSGKGNEKKVASGGGKFIRKDRGGKNNMELARAMKMLSMDD